MNRLAHMRQQHFDKIMREKMLATFRREGYPFWEGSSLSPGDSAREIPGNTVWEMKHDPAYNTTPEFMIRRKCKFDFWSETDYRVRRASCIPALDEYGLSPEMMTAVPLAMLKTQWTLYHDGSTWMRDRERDRVEKPHESRALPLLTFFSSALPGWSARELVWLAVGVVRETYGEDRERVLGRPEGQDRVGPALRDLMAGTETERRSAKAALLLSGALRPLESALHEARM